MAAELYSAAAKFYTTLSVQHFVPLAASVGEVFLSPNPPIAMQMSAATPRTRPDNRAVLDALSRCIAACELCADACLDEADIKMQVACIRLDRDCADICRLTAAFIARGSDHAQHVLKECMEICRKCHDECAKHTNDHCKKCAEACKACLEACQKYAA